MSLMSLMRKLLFAATFLLLASAGSMAQDNPRAEASGGFSYLHAGHGGNFYGWDGSLAGNLNKWFGIVGEFSGHYSSSSAGVTTASVLLPAPVLPNPFTFSSSADSNVYTFLFGPRLSYRKDKRLTPFAYVLPGFARSHTSLTTVFAGGGTPTTPGFTNHTSLTTTGFAMAVGGGLDLKLTGSLAFRVIQADYLLTHLAGSTQNDARITTGLVYRFGK